LSSNVFSLGLALSPGDHGHNQVLPVSNARKYDATTWTKTSKSNPWALMEWALSTQSTPK
jgi:hypothetical protein